MASNADLQSMLMMHDAFPQMGQPMDVNDHPDMNLPQPAPSVPAGISMAGDQLPMPGEMKAPRKAKAPSKPKEKKSKKK